MKGDFSRDSFDPRKRFSRVMMQQGRVQLDSDWNEQTSLTLGYIRTLAGDLLGEGAGPEAACGFRIVDGKDAAPDPVSGKPDPTSSARKKPSSQALKNGELMILPGRYYVGGILVELDSPMLYSAQPGYPFSDATSTDALKGADTWIAYLDVWEEFVSADQDDDLREPALGGADSCGRALIRWQVRILVDPGDKILKDFAQFRPGDRGTLTAWTKPGETPDKPCIIPPDARYRGLENQLYRVEIHRGSDESGGGATFKWSRDNGSLVYRVKDVNDELVRLDHLGRDERSELAVGQWVQLADDMWTGHDPGGPLGRISEVRRDERSVIVQWAKPVTSLPTSAALAGGLRPVLRRWDHQADVEANGGAIPIDSSGEIELEDGIFIRFQANGPYRAGDYWLIPARVATGGILWPGAAGTPEPRPPHGPAHFYAPLADFQGGKLTDRRRKFAPISLPL
jgi:hypothetical protein